MKLELTILTLAVILITLGCCLRHPKVATPCPIWVDGNSTKTEKLPEGCKVRCDDVGCYVENGEDQ